jgi:hypothetical protein
MQIDVTSANMVYKSNTIAAESIIRPKSWLTGLQESIAERQDITLKQDLTEIKVVD